MRLVHDKWLTLSELTAELRISRSTLNRMRREGAERGLPMPCQVFGRQLVRVRLREVEEWAAHLQPPSGAARTTLDRT